jgi:outer membrane protein, heavy metal efflux system
VDVLYRRMESERRDGMDVGFSIPLPVFDRSRGRIGAAQAESQAAEARSRSARIELDQNLRAAHRQLATALAVRRALKEELLPRAETILKAFEARYEAGDISLAELLPARRDWAAGQLTRLESLHDVMQAWTHLSAFMPNPPPTP